MNNNNQIFKYLKNDLPSGLVVFLVALPLCLGISLASGAPFFSGLIAGIIGGIVVGTISSSKLSVSGPAAGLAALVLAAIHNIGDYRLFLCAVVIAGILQLVMAVLRLGGLANYIPSSVVKGMLTSIGILIIAKQIPHAFGFDHTAPNGFGSSLDADHTFGYYLSHFNFGVTIITLLSIAIIVLWDRPFIKQRVKFIPGALVAVLAAIGLNELWRFTGSGLAIPDQFLVQVKVANTFQEFLGFFTLPNVSGFTNSTVIVTGVMIAIIASLETLLCIEAVDNIDPERNVTNTNRELIAQGIGNISSGLIGGLPITSVIVRSSANINAGAKTKMAAIFHGFLLLVSLVFIPGLLNHIPLGALAAILLLTGYKLSKPSSFVEMVGKGKYQYIPFFVTVAIILALDLFGIVKDLKGEGLLIGVIAGLFTAFIGILHGNLKNSYYFHKENHHDGDAIKITLSEEVSFLNKAAIRETLDALPNNSNVIIDASRTHYIDHDVIELIKEFRDIKAGVKHINCKLLNFKEAYNVENDLNVQSVH